MWQNLPTSFVCDRCFGFRGCHFGGKYAGEYKKEWSNELREAKQEVDKGYKKMKAEKERIGATDTRAKGKGESRQGENDSGSSFNPTEDEMSEEEINTFKRSRRVSTPTSREQSIPRWPLKAIPVRVCLILFHIYRYMYHIHVSIYQYE
jgi:hypothetical protein